MGLAAAQLFQLVDGVARHGIRHRADRQGDQQLVRVQAGIVVAQVLHLQMLDRLDDARGDEQQFFLIAGQVLERVHQAGRGRAQQGAGLAGDDGAVGQLQRHGRAAGLLRALQRGGHHGPVGGAGAHGVHDQLDLPGLGGVGQTLAHRAGGGIIAADDLLLAGLPAGLVVHQAVARHVDAHVRGALVGALAVDLAEHGLQHREDLHVPVVVDRGHAVGLQMEGVDHIHIVQVGRGGLVGQVHRVLEGQVPDREGLKLGIAGLNAPLVLMVELAEAGGHLAAAGAGGRDHHQGTAGLNVFVAAEALLRDDQRNVGGIIGDDVVEVDRDTQGLQALFELVRDALSPVVGDDHAADEEPDAAEGVDQAERILVIGDAQVAAALAALNVVGRDGDDDLRLLLHLQQHLHLAVRLKAREHAGGVIVVEKLAAELQIQLAAELGDPVPDLLGLELYVFVVVKTDSVHGAHPRFCQISNQKYSTERKRGQETIWYRNHLFSQSFF